MNPHLPTNVRNAADYYQQGYVNKRLEQRRSAQYANSPLREFPTWINDPAVMDPENATQPQPGTVNASSPAARPGARGDQFPAETQSVDCSQVDQTPRPEQPSPATPVSERFRLLSLSDQNQQCTQR